MPFPNILDCCWMKEIVIVGSTGPFSTNYRTDYLINIQNVIMELVLKPRGLFLCLTFLDKENEQFILVHTFIV
jgi:hypothetical protein